MQDYKPSSRLRAKRPRLDLSPGHGVSDHSGPSVPEPIAQPPPASEDRLVVPLPIRRSEFPGHGIPDHLAPSIPQPIAKLLTASEDWLVISLPI